MELGLIIDHADAGIYAEQEWTPGEARKSFWTGLNLSGKARHPVRTYRCSHCGYLESYARTD